MTAIIAQLFSLFAPMVAEAIQHYTKTGVAPTRAELQAILDKNSNAALDEWDAWLAAHPNA
jgi:hypothetical protein